jgi:hypothetical protein
MREFRELCFSRFSPLFPLFPLFPARKKHIFFRIMDMENHKYSLAKRGKSICPECKKRTFVLYINSMTGEPLHPDVGKCDRADNCGHHYTPKQYFTDNHIPFDKDIATTLRMGTPSRPQPAPSYIDAGIFQKSLRGYENNNLVQFLRRIAGDEATEKAVEMYHIGTSQNGGTVFWEIDRDGKIRAGKIIQYGTDGHRRKDVTPPVQWVHKILHFPEFALMQCFFGEHLIKDTTKPVAIVESEKTAVIASCYLPEFIWIACGGSEGINPEKCKCLKDRKTVLCPDAGMFDKWSEKADCLQTVCDVSVSSLIEEHATEEERKKGYDLADY